MPWFPGQVSCKPTGTWETSIPSKPWYLHVRSEPSCIPPSPHSGEVRSEPHLLGRMGVLRRTDTYAWERPPVLKEWPVWACLYFCQTPSPSTTLAAPLSHPIQHVLSACCMYTACLGYRIEWVSPLRVPGLPAMLLHKGHGGVGAPVHCVSTMCWCAHFSGQGEKGSFPDTKIFF